MSRTWKDRKGYKTRRKRRGYPVPEICNYTRGGYDDYDHSDEELYVDDHYSWTWASARRSNYHQSTETEVSR